MASPTLLQRNQRFDLGTHLIHLQQLRLPTLELLLRLLLHLLAPNFRPQQVTEDLESFWNTTYQVVRKELRGRYPRHPWPEDPWTAQAVNKPSSRRP